jgi:O-antigen chain-terminating methyltransferase
LERILSLLNEHKQKTVQELAQELPPLERQDDYKYLVFENRYRGDETTIKHRFQAYIQYFQDCHDVLDLGCGRGEFLELLRENDITGYGVDVNQVMIEYCRRKDLRIQEGEALEHLQSLPDNSLDGIFSAQMVEHYSPKSLQQLLQVCFEKLQHQRYLIIETQNPQSLYALSHFYRDLFHQKPIHPDALQFLLKSVGFQDIQVEYKVPFSPELLLQEIDLSSVSDEVLRTQLTTVNKNIRQLNEIIYGFLDYAMIARKVKIF